VHGVTGTFVIAVYVTNGCEPPTCDAWQRAVILRDDGSLLARPWDGPIVATGNEPIDDPDVLMAGAYDYIHVRVRPLTAHAHHDADPVPARKRDKANAKAVTARVIGVNVRTDVIIQIAAGSSQGIKPSWRGHVLRGDTDERMVEGDITLIRVDKHVTLARTKLTTDLITKNPYVRLSPPRK
jgi:hypothetical protein